MPIASKSIRKCLTCRYWTGEVTVKSTNYVEFPSGQRAKCNLTGQLKPDWTSCPKYQRSLNF